MWFGWCLGGLYALGLVLGGGLSRFFWMVLAVVDEVRCSSGAWWFDLKYGLDFLKCISFKVLCLNCVFGFLDF